MSVTVSVKKAFSFGGVVEHENETDAKIGEDGREYGTDATSALKHAEQNREKLLLRNVKSVIA